MKLKTVLFPLALTFFTVSQGFSGDITTRPSPATTINTETPVAVRSQQLMNRLEEIKAMDTKKMSRTEKKSLRKEVRKIEKEMKTLDNGGVYLSVGAIIIIVLLLILIL